jgi:hypothetical protein
MQQSPSWEASSCSASHETSHHLRNSQVQYHVHKSLPVGLAWASSIQTTPSHTTTLRSILILVFHPCLGLLRGHFPSGFWAEILYAFLIPPMHATCPTHIILNFITLVIYVFWRSEDKTFCNYCRRVEKYGHSTSWGTVIPRGGKQKFAVGIYINS